jgi:hypothetical protein
MWLFDSGHKSSDVSSTASESLAGSLKHCGVVTEFDRQPSVVGAITSLRHTKPMTRHLVVSIALPEILDDKHHFPPLERVGERRVVPQSYELLNRVCSFRRQIPAFSLVFSLLRQNGFTLAHVCDYLKDERYAVLSVVKREGKELAYASTRLQNDRGVAIAAVEQNGLALAHASERLRHDGQVVLAATKQDTGAVAFASDEALKEIRSSWPAPVLTVHRGETSNEGLASIAFTNLGGDEVASIHTSMHSRVFELRRSMCQTVPEIALCHLTTSHGWILADDMYLDVKLL